MGFHGREHELVLMQRAFGSSGQNVTLIYGRRRVGKSELIKQALTQSDARAIYYECKETSEENNVESLAAPISETYGLPPLAFPSMEKLFEFLFTRSGESKLILVLDEYPYLRTAIKRV